MTEKLMNFLPKHIPNIIAGVKTQSRRLKKEGEIFEYYADEKGKAIYPIEVKAVMRFKTQKIKFAVGDVRQVAVKGKPVWYCPNCNYVYKKDRDWFDLLDCINTKETTLHNCVNEKCFHGTDLFKPLKIKVLSIKREERLTSITHADAVAEVGEGLKYPRQVFFQEFIECYRKPIPNPISYGRVFPLSVFEKVAKDWDPLEWPIEFEVVE